MQSFVARIFLARILIATCPVVFVFHKTVWLFGAHHASSSHPHASMNHIQALVWRFQSCVMCRQRELCGLKLSADDAALIINARLEESDTIKYSTIKFKQIGAFSFRLFHSGSDAPCHNAVSSKASCGKPTFLIIALAHAAEQEGANVQ